MKTILTSTIALALLGATRLAACDLCGCTIVNHPWEPRAGFYLGTSEQFTSYGTLQSDGRKIDNEERQDLHSSITQAFVGFNFTRSLGLQVNVPYIDRSFRRTAEDHIENGNVSGIGDTSLLLSWVPFQRRGEDFTFVAKLSGGVKFPTGDSDRIAEEGEEGHDHSGGESDGHSHELTPSGIHGHDLALGSGSIDGIVGGSVFVKWKRAFFAADAQYAIRSEGDFDYQYANDFLWNGGPGVVLFDRDNETFSAQFVCSGETKGEDKFRGAKAEDTAVTTVYLGPKFAGTWRDHFTAEVGLDAPVFRGNSGIQAVPDYRLRATMSWAF